MKQPQIQHNMNDDQYFSSDRTSKSDLDLIHRSPLHYKYYKEHPTPTTDTFTLGSAYHTLILEPHTFENRFVIVDKCDRRTKEGKAKWAEYEADPREKLSFADFVTVEAMRDSFMDHPAAYKLLNYPTGSLIETPIFNEINGIKTRIKPDLFRRDLCIIVDLKSTKDASWKAFQKSIANFRYHVQAAFYLDNAKYLGADAFIFICQEKDPPYAVAVYQLEEEDIKKGRVEYEEDLFILKRCIENNSWPGYGNRVMPIQLPSWAKR